MTRPSTDVPIVTETRLALSEGRAPRNARALSEAIRRLKAEKRHAAAADAYLTLAELEQRRGNPRKAQAAARGALRLTSQNGLMEAAEESLDALARISSRAGLHDQARRFAADLLARARKRGDTAGLLRALLRVAQVEWDAGRPPAALAAAEEAAGLRDEARDPALAKRAERTLAGLLLRAGCPTAALDLLSRSRRGSTAAEATVPTLLLRGYATVCLGRPGPAARDFRKVRRLVREGADRRPKVVAAAALAGADVRQALRSGDVGRGVRACAAVAKARGQAARARDPEVVQTVDRLTEDPKPLATTAKQAAEALVRLAQQADSPTLVAAAMKEVRRMQKLPPGEPPYHCPLTPPFPLE